MDAPSLRSQLLRRATRARSSNPSDVVDAADELAIAALTAAELIHRALGSDEAHRAKRLAYVERFLSVIPIEDYDFDVARRHAQLLDAARRVGRPHGTHDLIIAATALARNRTVLTRDKTGFTDLPGLDVRIV